MKHTITFNLPDDQWSLDIHMKAPDLAAAVDDFDNLLRRTTKYGDFTPFEDLMENHKLTEGELELISAVVMKIRQMLSNEINEKD